MECYTPRMVLLSTKDKLAEIEGKLKELSCLTNIEKDKNIDNVRYVLYSPMHRDKPELHCVVEYNKKRIKGMWKELLKAVNLYIWGVDSGTVLWDNNGNCHIDIGNYVFFVKDNNKELFRDIAEGLFTDEFVLKFLNNTFFYPKEKGVLEYMDLAPNWINLNGAVKDSFHSIYFTYYPFSKTANFLSHEPNYEVSDETIRRLLDEELNIECLNDYQRSFIDSSNELNKEILIPRFHSKERKIDFNVIEDEKCLRLVRK